MAYEKANFPRPEESKNISEKSIERNEKDKINPQEKEHSKDVEKANAETSEKASGEQKSDERKSIKKEKKRTGDDNLDNWTGKHDLGEHPPFMKTV